MAYTNQQRVTVVGGGFLGIDASMEDADVRGLHSQIAVIPAVDFRNITGIGFARRLGSLR